MDTAQKPASNAVVIGHIDLPAKKTSPTPIKDRLNAKMGQQRRSDRARQPDRPRNSREANSQAMSELQYLKAQIRSLRNDLTGYDDLRAEVAKFLEVAKAGGDATAAVKSLAEIFKGL